MFLAGISPAGFASISPSQPGVGVLASNSRVDWDALGPEALFLGFPCFELARIRMLLGAAGMEEERKLVMMGRERDQFPAGMRVLAVDDDPVCLKVLEILLRRCRYHGEHLLDHPHCLLLYYYYLQLIVLSLEI